MLWNQLSTAARLTTLCKLKVVAHQSEGTQSGTWWHQTAYPISRWGTNSRPRSLPIKTQHRSSSCRLGMILSNVTALHFLNRWIPFTCQVQALLVLDTHKTVFTPSIRVVASWPVEALVSSINSKSTKCIILKIKQSQTIIAIMKTRRWYLILQSNSSFGSHPC